MGGAGAEKQNGGNCATRILLAVEGVNYVLGAAPKRAFNSARVKGRSAHGEPDFSE